MQSTPASDSTSIRISTEVSSPHSELEAICQAMGDGVAVFDRQGQAVLVNQAKAALYGYSTPDEMKRHLAFTKELFEVYGLDGSRIPHEEWPLMRVLRGETLKDMQVRVRRKDIGLERIISCNGGPVYDATCAQTLAVIVSRDISPIRKAEDLLDAQKRSLEMVLRNAPLEEVLSFLTDVVEKQSESPAFASILMLDHEGRLRHGAAPSLPDSYNHAIDGLKARRDLGTCSDAVIRNEAVVTTDIENSPEWATIKHLPLAIGLQAAWSQPIRSREGHVLGTFGTYFKERREPSAQERRVVEMLAAMAAIAIEHAQDEKTLRQNEAQSKFLVNLDDMIRPLTDPQEITQAAARLLGRHLQVNRCAYADVEADEETFNLTGDYYDHVKSMVGRYHLRQFSEDFGMAMRQNKPYLVEDCETDPRCDSVRDNYRAAEIRSMICVPLHKGGRFVASMAVHSVETREWLQQEVELLQGVAARCWESIERARVTRSLQESEKQFRDAANSITQMIWVTRPDGYHEYYNNRWYDYTGVPRGSTDGVAWNGMFHAEDQERAWARWRQSLATGEPYEIEYRLRRADGVYRWVLGRAECVRNEKGEIAKWYGTCTDIQDLVDARQKAEEANIAKSEFLANMSHEIRTPMNAVIGLANILALSSPLTPKQKEFIRTLQLSADALLELINDLLDIAKIEARTVELEKTPFSLARMMQEVISIMSVRSQEKGLDFLFEGDAVKDRIFIGDPTRLRQVVINLCSNAVKFTESGSVRIGIHCEPSPEPGHERIRLRVADTGIGIAPDKLGVIFHKFMQADTSINRKYGGTGLGLAITQTLVGLMGGTIQVESVVGKGSTFTVELTLPAGEAKQAETQPEKAVSGISDAIRPRILLVEDYAPNIMVATSFLDQFGYDYVVVNNGLEAVEQVQKQPYAAILMDIQMHGMNGLEATRLIRIHEAQSALPPTPIIGMTAHALAGDKERCLGVGMDDYISKPFNPDQLEELLKTYSRRTANA